MEWVAIKLLFSGIFGAIGRFLSAALTFLTTKPGVYILIAAIAVGAYWYSGHEGYKRGVAETVAADRIATAEATAAAYKAGLLRQQKLDKAISTISFNAGVEKGKTQAKTIVLIRKVPVYVTAETDRSFPMPCGLYRVLRAAADNGADPATIAIPAGLVDADSCPFTASDVAENGVAIAGDDFQLRAQITGLQNLVKELAAEIEQ